MKYQNNATLIRREILMRLAKAFYADKLLETIDHIPIDRIPKNKEEMLRCCIYKERAIIKYRIMADLGFGIEDETDEAKRLCDYAKESLETPIKRNEEVLSIIDIACSSCVQSQYLVTNACRGCMARPCVLNCPTNAITVVGGQAVIDHKKCIDCGKCQKVCPYSAIARISIPCEEACPVGAIGKDKQGKAVINFDQCIACGKCMNACPFGAIVEKSHFIKVLQTIKDKTPVVAMIAPSIAGQFEGDLEQIASAIMALGFTDVIEVAIGADITSEHEKNEFIQEMQQGAPLMTSSCCPAYTAAVDKHIPELKPFVSKAKTPLYYTADLIKKAHPDYLTVFIGPCIAKRKEAQTDQNVDFVLTFEELEALFMARGIDTSTYAPMDMTHKPSSKGRGFATSCGVTAAMLEHLQNHPNIQPEFIEDINKKTIKQLKNYLKIKGNKNFLEVMGCEGGCVGGPCTIGKLQAAKLAVKKAAKGEA